METIWNYAFSSFNLFECIYFYGETLLTFSSHDFLGVPAKSIMTLSIYQIEIFGTKIDECSTNTQIHRSKHIYTVKYTFTKSSKFTNTFTLTHSTSLTITMSICNSTLWISFSISATSPESTQKKRKRVDSCRSLDWNCRLGFDCSPD